ncbi:hypothetical protein [Aestuariispira insulae]|uniref:Uncharacterized protein n=1 Tax=Aestuariispira insulae TaxID=1461337 RepID=A0A3D9HRP7_9PROT|nr:hypothetical protein [Aestuariispira insulae]RED52184.1 hypothetical protein DFP90_102202 [Aestuariispira insulae]
MAVIKSILPAFSRGEISPLVQSRVDLESYRTGLSVCENFQVMAHGVLMRRPGTRFIASAKHADKAVRLIAFEYSVNDTYILEFGDLYMRVYRDGGQILTDEDEIYELATGFGEDQLFELDYAQDERTLYIVHKDHAPKKLVRNDHDDWTIADVSFTSKPSQWTAGNYPQRIGFFEQRMVLCATPGQPSTYWLSKSPTGTAQDLRLTNFGLGTNADDALKFTTTSGMAQEIQWVVEDKHLISGTTGGIRSVGGAGFNTPLSITSIQNRMQTKEGSAPVRPVKAGDAVLFLSRNRKQLHETRFTFEKEGWLSPPISRASEHVTGPGIREMAFADEPDAVLWMLRDDGQLVGVTYEPHEQVLAYHRHLIGGRGMDQDWAEVESIACVFEGQRRALYLAVRRKINGEARRFIERLDPLFRTSENQTRADAFFVDAGGSYQGESTGQVTGFGHLAGEQVDILADGAVLPRVTVAEDGSVTLPNGATASTIQVGLPAPARVVPLEPLYQTREGASKGDLKRPVSVTVDLFESGAIEVGVEGKGRERKPLRPSELPFGAAEPLYSALVKVKFPSGHDLVPRVEIAAREPLPCTIRAIIPEMGV